MDITVDKNRKWIVGPGESIGKLEEDLKASIMKPIAEECAADLLKLCEEHRI